MNKKGDVDIRIRRAVERDIPSLRELIILSVRMLQAGDYAPEQMEGALETVFGVDSQLIEDGTYFVAEMKAAGRPPEADLNAEARDEGPEWVLAGCGGGANGDATEAITGQGEDAPDQARRGQDSSFVHPAWARRGIGSKILEACEIAASAAGFTSFEMGATLTGAKLFGKKGYVAVENIEVPLKNGQSLPVIRMAKRG